MPPCPECGELTVWNDELSSAVCTECGTLADTSVTLVSSYSESTHTYDPLAILKSIRTRPGWHLVGQGKEATERKNTVTSVYLLFRFVSHPFAFIQYAIHQFIRSIA